MSKVLINKLQEALNIGELKELVEGTYSFNQLLQVLGYAGGADKGQYKEICRNFLTDNNISFIHYSTTSKPKRKDIIKTCIVCGKEFRKEYSKKAKGQLTCSYSCSNTYFRSGKDNPNWKGGFGSYRDRAFIEYGKKCQLCGYESNEHALEVHHIDMNRSNNEIDNLIVLCANCHKITHYELDPTFGNN